MSQVFKGSISYGEAVLLENIRFHITSVQEVDSGVIGMTSWSATFVVPKGGGEAAETIYDEDGPFLLVLEDGRVGECRCVASDGLHAGSTFHLAGTGGLRKPAS